MHAIFVDRVDDLDELRAATARLPQREGAAVVLEGRSGIGKSALLARFAQDPGGDGSGAENYRVVSTACLPGIGKNLAYGPIIEILLELQRRSTRRAGLGRVLRFTGRGVAQAAPDVLSSLVPALGPVLKEARDAIEAAFRAGSMPLDSLQPYEQAIARRVVDRLLELVRSGKPVVLIIDDAQFIDDTSLLVLDLLLRRIGNEPLTVVFGLTSAGVSDEPEPAVAQLVQRWVAEGLVRRRPVGALPQSAVAELVDRLQPSAPADFPEQLTQATGGLPMFVNLCLQGSLPQDGSRIELPESVTAVVQAQLAALPAFDRRLLTLAAIQGRVFLSHFLAQSAASPNDEVLERLRLLAQPRTLIRPVPTAEQPEWAQAESADVYAFDHLLLWDAVYQAQTEEQRRSRHEGLARVIAQGLEEYERAPLGLRLELARHLELGGPPCARDSVDLRLDLARSAAMSGLSFSDAEAHCKVAIAAAQDMREGMERNRRLVRAIETLLSMTEVRWRGQRAVTGEPSNIDVLAQQAEKAAKETKSPELIAVTTLLRGKTLLATQGLGPALEKLAEAVDRAEQLGDPVRTYVAKVEYGRQVSKRNLAEGLAVLRELEQSYATEPELDAQDELVFQHARNLGEMQLGVTLFDSGYLEESLGRLQRCVDRLRGESINLELPIAFNYLAQVQIAFGFTEQAEATLREALDFEERRGGDSGWHAYNAALLALVLSADRRRAEEARELIEDAWQETTRTWLLNLVPIVRNFRAEILLALPRESDPDAERRLLEHADNLAVETCIETAESGMVRSRIPALCLRARIHLRAGRSTQAAQFAREAVGVLEEMGDMPALRTEEVYFHAASVLWADGDADEAAQLLERARAAVARKAERIEDPQLRRSFLQDVALNRWIKDGLPGEGRTLECIIV